MPIPLGAKPQADFSEPIGLMMDCHRRIEHFLDVLLRIVDRASGGPLDREHRDALETALTYFRSAAPQHTADEERSLFPRLRRSSDPAVQASLARVEALERDHVIAQTAHDRVDALGRQWLKEGRLPGSTADKLRETLNGLQLNYQRHIRMEDEEVFPLATRTLTENDLTAIGAEMKDRRQTRDRA